MKSNRIKRLGFIVLGVVAGGLAADAAAQGGPPPAKVVVGEATMMPIEQKRRVTGELRAVRRSLLAAEHEGIVELFDLREGDSVEEGQVVAVLRDDLAKIAVTQAEAVVVAAEGALAVEQATLANVKLDFERITELRAGGSASQSEFDHASTDVTSARARVKRAEGDLAGRRAQLALAKQQVEQLTVRAPFSGRIVEKRVEIGEWVDKGDAVARILSLDEIEAVVDVPEHLFEQVRSKNASVDLRIDAADVSVTERITAVVPDVDPLSRLFRVRITLANEDERLRPGMAVIGFISTGRTEPMLTVPKDAVLRDDAGEFVYFNAGGVSAPARVTTLFAVGDRVAIRSLSLPPGAQVVIEGNERMFPGQPLVILNGDPHDPHEGTLGGVPGERPSDGEQAAKNEPAPDEQGG